MDTKKTKLDRSEVEKLLTVLEGMVPAVTDVQSNPNALKLKFGDSKPKNGSLEKEGRLSCQLSYQLLLLSHFCVLHLRNLLGSALIPIHLAYIIPATCSSYSICVPTLDEKRVPTKQ